MQGVIPRALRGRNPLQMFNPNAPAKCGTAGQIVIVDPDSGKWKGIKLFEISLTSPGACNFDARNAVWAFTSASEVVTN